MKKLIKAAAEFFKNTLATQLNKTEVATQVEALECNRQLLEATESQQSANEIIAYAIELAKCGIREEEIPDLIAFFYGTKYRGLVLNDLDKLTQIRRIMGSK